MVRKLQNGPACIAHCCLWWPDCRRLITGGTHFICLQTNTTWNTDIKQKSYLHIQMWVTQGTMCVCVCVRLCCLSKWCVQCWYFEVPLCLWGANHYLKISHNSLVPAKHPAHSYKIMFSLSLSLSLSPWLFLISLSYIFIWFPLEKIMFFPQLLIFIIYFIIIYFIIYLSGCQLGK